MKEKLLGFQRINGIMTRKQLAEALKRRFSVRYSINGVNIFVRGDVDLDALHAWLLDWQSHIDCSPDGPLAHIRMSTVNPHFRACFYSIPAWLSLFVEHKK